MVQIPRDCPPPKLVAVRFNVRDVLEDVRSRLPIAAREKAFPDTAVLVLGRAEEIEHELRRAFFSEMTAAELQKTVILNAKSLMEKDADFSKFAGRILILPWAFTRSARRNNLLYWGESSNAIRKATFWARAG